MLEYRLIIDIMFTSENNIWLIASSNWIKKQIQQKQNQNHLT